MNKKIKDKSLTRDQCAQVLSVAKDEMRGLILVAMTTGQRIRDILMLKHDDVDHIRKIIRFNIPKTGTVLEMRLDPLAAIWVNQQLKSSMPVESTPLLFPKLAVGGVAKAGWSLRQLGRKVGVNLCAVSLRHTFIKELYAKGTPMRVILMMMGYRRRN